MTSKLIASLTVSTLALSGAMVLSQSQTALAVQQRNTTTFNCVAQGQNNFATIAQRGTRTTPPIMLWKTTEFGPNYTPQERCRIVSDKLTQAVNQNGGRLSNLYLSTGTVNRLPVVCYLNGAQSSCNSSNVLFTLDRKNASNPNDVLNRLLTFGQTGSGGPVVSFVPSTPSRPSQPQPVSLENVVNQAFAATGGRDPVRPSRPGSRPGGI
jgi:hypothetical protein